MNTVKLDFENVWKGILYSTFSLPCERKKRKSMFSFYLSIQDYLYSYAEKYHSGKLHNSQDRNETFPE